MASRKFTINGDNGGIDAQARRDSAAAMIEQQRSSITLRIHRLLRDDARKLTDTEDVLSTALRRIDSLILRGQMEAESDEQFYALVHRVIERTIRQKARASSRLRRRELFAQQFREDNRNERNPDSFSQTIDFVKLGSLIRNPIDREIVLLRGRDLSFRVIAETMDMDPTAVRMRWSRLCAKVRKEM